MKKEFNNKYKVSINFKKFIFFLILLTFVFFLIGCASKNYTIKNNLKKKIQFTIAQGDSYFNSYQLEKALNSYNEALKIIYLVNDLENEIIVNLKIAQIYILKNDSENAKIQIDLVASLIQYFQNDKVYFNYYQVNAQYLVFLKNYDEALKDYKKSLEYTKNKKLIANIYNKIAKVYIKLQNYVSAETYLNNAIKINKAKKYYDGLGDNYYNLGLVEYYKKNYENAISYLNQALENDKINENIYGIFSDLNLIAKIYITTGDYDKAKFYLNESYKLAKSTENKTLIEIVENKLKELEKEY